MRKKEIKEKFEKLDKEIKSLEKGYEEKFEKLDEQIKSLEEEREDLYEIAQFILEAIRKYTDKPIYQVRKNYDQYGCYGHFMQYALQYAYKNQVKEIETYENIQSTELFAYCDTHFILKNQDNKYFLVDMAKGILTNIPAQLLFSKEIDLTNEKQVLKVCQSTNCIGIKRPDND